MDYKNEEEKDNFIDDDSSFFDTEEETEDFTPVDNDFDHEEAEIEPIHGDEETDQDSPLFDEPSGSSAEIQEPEKQETPSSFRVMRFEDFIKS